MAIVKCPMCDSENVLAEVYETEEYNLLLSLECGDCKFSEEAPDLGVWSGEIWEKVMTTVTCPKCGSDNVQPVPHEVFTLQCGDCQFFEESPDLASWGK